MSDIRNMAMGVVKRILEHTADIQFDEGLRTVAPDTCGLQPGEAQAEVSGLEMPLNQFVREVVGSTVAALGLTGPEEVIEQLAARWHKGNLVLQPSDRTLQSKEVPIDVFFHKIVMMRDKRTPAFDLAPET